jgi:predicted Kef-type K+ transport protein
MPNPFDWDYLTSQPASGDVLDAFTIIYAAIFILGFVASAYLYYRPWTKPFGAMFRRKSVIAASGMAMWIFGIGLFFFLIRLLQINPLTLGQPIWMWLSILAVIAMAVLIGMNWKRSQALGPAATRARTASPQVQPASRRPVRRDKAHR